MYILILAYILIYLSNKNRNGYFADCSIHARARHAGIMRGSCAEKQPLRGWAEKFDKRLAGRHNGFRRGGTATRRTPPPALLSSAHASKEIL